MCKECHTIIIQRNFFDDVKKENGALIEKTESLPFNPHLSRCPFRIDDEVIDIFNSTGIYFSYWVEKRAFVLLIDIPVPEGKVQEEKDLWLSNHPDYSEVQKRELYIR